MALAAVWLLPDFLPTLCTPPTAAASAPAPGPAPEAAQPPSGATELSGGQDEVAAGDFATFCAWAMPAYNVISSFFNRVPFLMCVLGLVGVLFRFADFFTAVMLAVLWRMHTYVIEVNVERGRGWGAYIWGCAFAAACAFALYRGEQRFRRRAQADRE